MSCSKLGLFGLVGTYFSFLSFACGGVSSTSNRHGNDADAGDAGISDADYEMRGVYRCCREGIGTSCCEGTKEGTCFQYGGNAGACTGEGQEYNAKDICAGCCPALTRQPAADFGDNTPPSIDGFPEGCDIKSHALFICVKCGDGICGNGENECNCPTDCPATDR